MHSAESPVKSMWRHWPLPGPSYSTENVPSMYPSSARKKNCMPFDACSSVRSSMRTGLSPPPAVSEPSTVEVKMPESWLILTVDPMRLPEAGRSGVT